MPKTKQIARTTQRCVPTSTCTCVTCQDRAYQRAANELAKRRKERRLAEIGFEPQKRREAEELRRARQEQRRDSKENRDRETHKVKIATAKIRLEREIIVTGKVRPAAATSESFQNHRTTVKSPPEQLTTSPGITGHFQAAP